MSHYDFSRMGWAQFEHMIQALAKAELGNGVRAFGSGPDGQREATFTGQVRFPIGAQGGAWNGFGVIQAKYLERTKGTVTADWRWFLEEVRSELRGWVAKKQNGKKVPQYFLAATNVVLTPGEDRGGIDRFDELLTSFQDELGLKGWYAWDDTELRTLLDNHTQIRQRYLELIVVGDFLAAIEAIAPAVYPTANRLAVHAASELTNKQWVRTGDAGYDDNSKLRLADVGIDLPCVGPKTRTAPDGKRMYGAAWAIDLADKAGRLDGVVFVGGPGQGKSTLAQLIAHAYRIAFIIGTDQSRFGTIAETAIDALRQRLRTAKIPLPRRKRWPLFINLSSAGAAAAHAGETFSLLAYLSSTITVEGHQVTPEELFTWMKSWPTCLVLDGLDEVPDSKVRSQLLASIAALVSEARANEVDLFIVATTRPQGYQGEFTETFDAKSTRLAEFSESEALDFSDALVAVKNANDPDLAKLVTERLIEAVHERVTQRLMTTPLQVTIMTALAERAVELPTNRFDLFDQYYQVIYNREMAKTDAFSELKTLRPHIDHLHERAALKLHSRVEHPSRSDATLSGQEVSTILARRLASAGFDTYRATEISANLVKLSTERLVMLVARPKKRYEFEVRSLQEYMAARALTDAPDDEILRLLSLLIPSAHWRNTWLLAAGRVLRLRGHLAPALFELVANYDERSAEASRLLLGASLAADLLVDDVAIEFPAIRRQLSWAALKTAARIDADIPDDLVKVLQVVLSEGGEVTKDALAQLDGVSHESLSNLASLYLHRNKSGMTPLAKQARVTMGKGRNYIKRYAAGAAPSTIVRALREDSDATPDTERFAKTIERAASKGDTWIDLLISPEVQEALAAKDVRAALRRAVVQESTPLGPVASLVAAWEARRPLGPVLDTEKPEG